MKEVFVLDTNAFFNYIKYSSFVDDDNDKIKESVNRIKRSDCFISHISTIEIMSVLGKYARGGNGAPKKMSAKALKSWRKLVDDILSNQSPVLSVSILPFSEETVNHAQRIIQYAMVHNFGSLDAMIAATANVFFAENPTENNYLVTSDKGFKACLEKCNIPYWDAFKIND